MRFNLKIFVVAALTTILLACSQDHSVPKLNLGSGMTAADAQAQVNLISSTPLLCSAGLPSSAGGVATPDVATPIEVTAAGGVGPYQILNSAVAFSSSTVIARTYTNSTSTNQAVVDTVAVLDSAGAVSQCNFVVTVLPKNSSSTLACTMTSSPTTAQLNSPVNLLVTASGGAGSYIFSNLNVDAGGSVTSSLAPISTTQASATVQFSTSGLKTNNVRVTDSAGTLVVCSSSVTVQAQAQVSVAASPAASVPVGNSITVTAFPTGFSSTPTYTWSTQESGVSIVPSPNGTTAVVTATNGQPHANFNVTVLASNASQSASGSLTLSFTAVSGNLTCTLSHTSGSYAVGDAVPFSVTATSGEALNITSFIVSSDAVVTTTSSSARSVKWSSSGTKLVYALAQSASTGNYCNQGAYLSDTVSISNVTPPTNPLSCSAYTSPTSTVLGQSFWAYGVLTGGNIASRWIDTLQVLKNGVVVNNYSGYWYDAYTAVLAIYNTPGTYQIILKAKDASGNTATCSTLQAVY